MPIPKKAIVFAIFIMTLLSCSKTSKTLLFVGSFTDKKPDTGIHVYELDVTTGAVQLSDSVTQIINPSFLQIAPNGSYLYAATESQLTTHGKIAAFRIDSLEGKLTLLNVQDAGGRNPAHIAVSSDSRYVVNSNYTDPSMGIFECLPDGSLQPLKQFLRFTDRSLIAGRQDEAHIHSANFSPDGRYIVAQDLGADKMRVFKFTPNDTTPLQPDFDLQVKVQPGSGPRHFTFHPNKKFAYGIAELNGKITAYAYRQGEFSFLASYNSYSKKQTIYRAADIHISPDGKFLYTSNRGPEEDTIAIFEIDQKSGYLTAIGHEPTGGEHPRNFGIDPSGNFLLVANQFSNNIVIFKRDQDTGKLTKLAAEIKTKGPSSIQMFHYQTD